MSVPFRTRFSAHLVSALAAPLMMTVHLTGVVTMFALPLHAAFVEHTPELIVLCWPVLLVWGLVYVAAKDEVAELPERFADAVARGDADGATDIRKLLGLFAKGDADAVNAVRLADELVLREQFSYARDLLARARPRDAHSLALLAYATARAGDPERGAEIARTALARTSPSDDRDAALEGALGIALVIAGRHADAIPALESATSVGGRTRVDIERSYWLGRAYRATGRDDDARVRLRIAAESDAPFADEARLLLERATPFRG
jgi:tetratricopeptide (TPR) repeat protein